MATDYLGLFASQYDFQYYKDMVYGNYNGYYVCIRMHGGYAVFYFNTQISEISSFNEILQGESANYGILSYKMSPPILAVMAQCEGSSLLRMLDFLTQLLRMCKATSSETCSFCGTRLKEEESIHFAVNDVVCVGHEQCFTSYNLKINKGTQDFLAALKPWYKVIYAPLLTAVICGIFTVLLISYFQLNATATYLAGALLTGYILSCVYTRKQGKWGTQGYAVCITITAITVFLIQLFYQSYNIMAAQGVALKEAMGIYFADYLHQTLFYGTIIPQMIMALAMGLLGVVVCVINRRRNISRTKVDIHKI